MDQETQMTVAMLRNLIASMEAGTVRAISRDGRVYGDVATFTLVVQGTPLPPNASLSRGGEADFGLKR